MNKTKAYTSTNNTNPAATTFRDRKTLGATTEVLKNGDNYLFSAKNCAPIVSFQGIGFIIYYLFIGFSGNQFYELGQDSSP